MASDMITQVSLRANVANFVTGMNQAAQATASVGSAADRLAQRRQLFDNLGKGLVAFGAVAAGGVALAVSKFAEFDQAMSSVQAATHASAGAMGQLRAAAIDAGAKTVYSATEAANAIEELSKAGLSTKDVLGGGLAGALNLAAAGGLEVADAAQQTAVTLKQFNLQGNQASHVADLLSAGAGKAVGDVSDLSAALGQAGLVANQTGLSVEDTTGVLAAFADKGLLGSDAGTSLKTMLQSLTPSSKQAADEFKKLGISAYDAQGNFVGITNFAGQYQTALKKLSPEQQATSSKIIFGSDAVRAANVLYTEGADGIQKYIDQTNDNGYAAETARIKLDNLRGDVEQLGGALDTALIQTGSGANSALRDLTQGATGLVNAFGQAPAGVQQTALVLGAVTAAAALAGGGFLLMVPKIAATRAALASMNVSGAAVARGFGKGGGVLLAITALTSAFSGLGSVATLTSDQVSKIGSATKLGDLKSLNAAFTGGGGVFDSVSKNSTGVKDALDSITSSSAKLNNGAAKAFDGLTFGLAKTSDTSKRFEAQFKQVGTTLGDVAGSDLTSATDAFNKLVKASGGGTESAQKLLDVMPDYKAALTDLAGEQDQTLNSQQLLNLAQGKGELAAKLSADAAKEQADGLAQLSGTATTAEGDIQDLADAISNFGKAQFDVNSTSRDFQAAIDDATNALKENGATLDVGSQKGRANAAALDQIGSSALASASAIYTSTNSQKAAAGAVQRGRDALVAQAQQFGLTKGQAQAYADRLGLIPKNVRTAIGLTGVQSAQEQINGLIRYNDGRVINIQTRNNVSTITGAGKSATTGAPRNAEGGHIVGPGTGTSDSILSFLSNGEYVIKAASVNKYGKGMLDALNSGNFPKFATGGPVRLTGASSSDRTSFRTSVRSGDYDGLNAVADLYRMAQDASAYSAGARAKYAAVANQQEQALLKLQSRSEKAASKVETLSSKVDDLKDSSASMASSVASSVSKFEVGDYGSAAGLKAGLSRSVGSATEFASLLKKLAKKGIAGPMLAEIASLGTADGLPLARSLDLATAGDISSINTSYKALGTIGAGAGKTVADANFGKLIAAAEKQLKSADRNADKITRAINRRGDELRKLVGRALSVKGYSAGGFTGSGAKFDVAGVVHAGEYVVNAAATANPRNRMMLESMNRDGFPAYASGGYANPVYVRGTGAGMDVSAVVAAIRSMPARQVIQNNDIRPIQNGDPQVITTTLGRELSRQMAGMV